MDTLRTSRRNSATPESGSRVTSSSQCLDDNDIVEFIDGLLSTREVERVEQHTAQCDDCREQLAEMARALDDDDDDRLAYGYSETLPAGGDAYIDLQPGEQLGRFRILSRVGRGGMGVVFAAYDPKLDRKVAIKLLHSRAEGASLSTEDAQKRLLREAQAMAQLSHPNVISVYDVGTYKSEVYIAMEFVDGETMSNWTVRWERTWQDILGKYVHAGKALADAHAAGLVHRDFKPDNVLVGHDNRVRVMDFGLARWVLTDESGAFAALAQPRDLDELDDAQGAGVFAVGSRTLSSLTKTGALLGTPRYMAPEQFSGLTADARSDQFSFCVALYEALYDQHPFEDRTSYGLVESPETTVVRPPTNSRVPVWLHSALVRGLSADAQERFPSMGALLREFDHAPKPPSARRLIALVAIAFIAMAAAVYFYRVSDTTQDDLADMMVDNRALETELYGLKHEFETLQVKLRRARTELSQVNRSHEQLVLELEDRIEETQTQLTTTLRRLKTTQRRLKRANRKLTAMATRPLDKGLRATQIEAQLNKRYRDFDGCLAEWSDRQSASESLLAVRFQIDSRGRPQRGSKIAGIDDRVIYECVVGLLESGDIQFPPSRGVTITNLGFRYTNGALQLHIEVIDVVDDVVDDAVDDVVEGAVDGVVEGEAPAS